MLKPSIITRLVVINRFERLIKILIVETQIQIEDTIQNYNATTSIIQLFFNFLCFFLKAWFFKQSKHILFIGFNSRLVKWVHF